MDRWHGRDAKGVPLTTPYGRPLVERGALGGLPGLHTPESLIDPEHAVARLLETGAAFVDA